MVLQTDIAFAGLAEVLEFSKLAPNVMLKLFRELVSHESDDFHYQLFLYCLKNKLHSEAESELKKIAAIEILAAADRFKDMEDAQQDLWKPLGN